jgi:hypothetical protein
MLMPFATSSSDECQPRRSKTPDRQPGIERKKADGTNVFGTKNDQTFGLHKHSYDQNI